MLATGDFDRYTKKIVRDKTYKPVSPFNPKLRLRSFGFNYPALLKLATLARKGGDRNARMKEFIDWMHFEWSFTAPATLLATIVLGVSPSKGAFKGLASQDRSKALKGVWNAAWDMVYVQEWFRRVKEQDQEGKLYVLCTRDVLMLRVADTLRKSMFEHNSEDEMFHDAGLSRSVVSHYRERMRQKSDPLRAHLRIKSGPEFMKYRRNLLDRLRRDFM
jgi:hypothetical protein